MTPKQRKEFVEYATSHKCLFLHEKKGRCRGKLSWCVCLREFKEKLTKEK